MYSEYRSSALYVQSIKCCPKQEGTGPGPGSTTLSNLDGASPDEATASMTGPCTGGHSAG